MNLEHYALTLHLAPSIGPKQARTLMENYPDAEVLFDEGMRDSPPNWPTKQEWKALQQEASMLLDKQESSNIKSFSLFNEHYPKNLLQIPDPPVIVFVKGQIDPSSDRIISVVGTRDSTPMGMDLTHDFVEGLSVNNCTIVSGLARGIDAQAHRSSVSLHMPTWAVLAHGLHTIHPRENFTLGERILGEGGAWISEWPLGTAPFPGAFPRRNRIIAGLAHATLVVEAAIKSGAGITAHLAHQYNREVFAIPGRVQDVRSQGCLDLIQRHVAQLVMHPKHIAEALGWFQQKSPSDFNALPKPQQKIWDTLHDGPLRLTTLCDKSQLGSETCLNALAEMMWEGKIRVSHGWYARDGPMA